MKQIMIIALSLGLLTVSLGLSAQEQLDFAAPAIPEVVDHSWSDMVSPGHSLSMTIIGLEYAYELPLGGYWSMVFYGGFSLQVKSEEIKTTFRSTTTAWEGYETTSTHSSTSVSYIIEPLPGITFEPRYYTSMRRRAVLGRKTGNNSSDFVSVKININTNYSAINGSITPVYGIRRGGVHWYREYMGGFSYQSLGNRVWPYLNFRIGYTF